jgi:hypothetical protein
MNAAPTILANLKAVKDEITAATKRYGAGKAPAAQIIAVTKTHGAEAVQPLLESGHRLFGENRVQEAQGKWPELKAQYPKTELHLIGPLQTNKVKEALALFDVIHTIDRPKLAAEIKKEMDKTGKKPALFIQVNTGKEPQTAGVMPEEADDFIAACKKTFGKQLVGLMCIPPAHEEPAPHFALLRTIAERNGLQGLSMGMSGDYGLASAMGASHVRIGSAIFGEREKA